MKVKVAPSCPTLCEPKDYTVHGVLQARILEWVAFSLLQQIFPTQESNRGLLHCKADFLVTELSEKPKMKVKVTQSYLTLCNPMDYTALEKGKRYPLHRVVNSYRVAVTWHTDVFGPGPLRCWMGDWKAT